MTCWEEIRRSHPNESPNPMGQLGMVSIRHHRAEVFLEEVNGQGGRTLSMSQRLCIHDPGYDVKLHLHVAFYISVGIEAALYHSCFPTLKATRLPQPGWQTWAATIHRLMAWCPSFCGLAEDPCFERTRARLTARVRERRHTQMPLKN